MAIWAQPCTSSVGCGPWAWWGAGSIVVDLNGGGNWWNTPYGTETSGGYNTRLE